MGFSRSRPLKKIIYTKFPIVQKFAKFTDIYKKIHTIANKSKHICIFTQLQNLHFYDAFEIDVEKFQTCI